MRERSAPIPLVLAQGWLDGWPPSCPVGCFLEHVRAGNTVAVSAQVAGLDPGDVDAWLTVGRRARARRTFAEFVAAYDRAVAECEAALVAVIMQSAQGEERDAWRAAAWILEHRAPPAPEPEPDPDDDISDLSAPVRDAADD